VQTHGSRHQRCRGQRTADKITALPKSLIVWTGNPKPLTQGAGNIPNNFKGQIGSPNVGPTRKVEINLLFLPLHWKTFGVSQDVGLNNCTHQAIKTHWRSSRPQAHAPALWCDHGAYCLRAARQLLHSVRRKADGKKANTHIEDVLAKK